MNKNREISGYAFIFILGILFTIKAYMIPLPLLQQDVTTTPSFFPVCAGTIFTIFALILFIGSLISNGKKATITNKEPLPQKSIPAYLILSTLLFYIILMQVFGWFLCSMLMLGVVLAIAGKATNKRINLWAISLFAVFFPVTIFILFDYLLGVPLPRGIWSLESLLGM